MKISQNQPRIIVVGSCSLDLVLNVQSIPQKNNTVIAKKVETYFGGKGANEAVAVARLGASAYLVSCVGMDPNGQQIMRNLVDENVNAGHVFETDLEPTGTAFVTSEKTGNSIVVVPSANYCLGTKHIDLVDKYFQTCDMVLLQLEIPMDVVEYTVNLAKKYNKKVGLYAAPAFLLSNKIVNLLDFIIVKNNELKTVFGEDFSDEVLKKYPNKLFIRDDNNSTTYFNGVEMKYQNSPSEDLQYRMGMGDAFTAGFAVALCHGNSIENCVDFGNTVSQFATKKCGAQDSLPYLKDLK
ncbi:MAG: ribokinase [Bacteroidetes bacterium]|nr:ribokinase [Bacteroidota bacterium]